MTIENKRAFYQELSSAPFSEEDQRHCSIFVEKIIHSFSLSPSPVLEFSTIGAGYYTLALAEKDFEVTTYEPFGELLFLNTQKMDVHGEKIKRITSPSLLINQKTQFNLAMNLDYSFGDYEDKNETENLLKFVRDRLASGGKIFLRIIGRDILEKYFYPKYWIEQPDGNFLLNERALNYDNGELEENYVLIKKEGCRKYQIKKRVYYPFEIQKILEDIGFVNIAIYSNPDKEPYHEKSEYMFVYAEKKHSNREGYIKC